MILILIQDVPKIGKKYEIKDVKEGFGRNFLLTRNLAVLWSVGKEKEYKTKVDMVKVGKAINEDLVSKNLTSLSGLKITISAVANKEGHLFAGVKASDIVSELKKEHRIIIPESIVELEHAIKNTGTHSIKVGTSEFTLEILGIEK